MSATTVPAGRVLLSDDETKAIESWVSADMQGDIGADSSPQGRPHVRTLVNLLDGLDLGHVATADVRRFVERVQPQHEGLVEEVAGLKRDLDQLIETGDTSEFWPSDTFAENIESQRFNLASSRRLVADLDLLIGLANRCQVS